MPDIQFRPLNPVVGAEVTGIDMRQMGRETFELIHEKLMQHGVLFFRDQPLTPTEHKAVGAWFGPLERHEFDTRDVEGHPEIWVLEKDEKTRGGRINQTRGWHTDVTCVEAPPAYALLHIQKLPEGGGGDTMWASMYAAYDALSEPMKAFIDPLTAVHDGNVFARSPTLRNVEAIPVAEHPVVRTHPVTKRKCLFVNSTFTKYIPQLNLEESDTLLQFLFRHVERPEYQCRFSWTPDTLAIWDERCTQHNPIHDYYPNKRRIHRVTVSGDRPY